MSTRRIIFACLVSLFVSATQVQAQTVIGSDDFDGGGVFLTRTFDPDNSSNDPPGSFGGSFFDVFGIVDRNVNFDFADDTLMGFSGGVFATTKTDNFLGSLDVENDQNPNETFVSLTYTFDISGQTDLGFSAEFASVGNFEAADLWQVSASIDGCLLYTSPSPRD